MDLYSTWSQLVWIDLTILFFSLPVASSNKFPEFQKQPECPAREANSWILKYAQRMLMELMDQPQVVKEQQLINSNSLITSYKNLAKKYTNLCLTYIPKDLLCSHDEVDMLTSSIVNDNTPCLIFSENFQASCQRLWKASHTCIILAFQWPWKLLLRLAHQLFWVFHPWALQALYFLNPNFAFSDLVLACYTATSDCVL